MKIYFNNSTNRLLIKHSIVSNVKACDGLTTFLKIKSRAISGQTLSPIKAHKSLHCSDTATFHLTSRHFLSDITAALFNYTFNRSIYFILEILISED